MTTQKYETTSHPYSNHDSKPSPDASTVVSQKQREHMIAEAAYYIAEHRNFQGGDPVSDWLQAQWQIDSNINATYRPKTQSN